MWQSTYYIIQNCIYNVPSVPGMLVFVSITYHLYQGCWYLNAGSFHDECEYVFIFIGASIDIYPYLELTGLKVTNNTLIALPGSSSGIIISI